MIPEKPKRMKSFTTARRHLSVFLATAHFLFWESTFAWYSPVNSRSLRPLASTPLRLPNIHAKSTSSSNEEKRLFFTLFSKATPQPSSAKAIDKGDSSARVNNRLQKTRRSENFKKQNSIKMMFRKAKTIERQGRWKEALNMFQAILEIAPLDAYSHLALARLEARREPKVRAKGKQLVSGEDDTFTTDSVGATSKARAAFETGTMACPNSVHLWQAWAVYEDSRGKFSKARDLFQDALSLDPYNSHVCHAYGLMEKKLGNETKARDLFERALSKHSTAALVCSLGEILIFNGEFKTARDLYAKHLQLLKVEKDRIEVYLASAWLEERYLHNYTRAQELLQSALSLNPSSSLANVALARLEGRMQRRSNKKGLSGNKATKKRLVSVCNKIENSNRRPSDPTDGRVFNALASLHVKSHRYDEACSILRKGMELYPLDHAVSIICLC